MDRIKIGKKEYVVLAKKEYEQLVVIAATKTTPAKKYTVEESKKRAFKLIDKWANKK